MRTQIRRNRELTYEQQMNQRRIDAIQSWLHPNGALNDHRQRLASREERKALEMNKKLVRSDPKRKERKVRKLEARRRLRRDG
jgi:hypothetical protein